MTRINNQPRFVPSSIKPTDEQKAVQLSQNRVVIVEANAGAAKTTTLALRIGEALARGLIAEEILAITFTKEASEVLRKRLPEIGIAPKLASSVRIEC